MPGREMQPLNGSKADRRRRSERIDDALAPSPTYSSEAESAVLGCMLAQPAEVMNDAVEHLKKDDFFKPASQVIFLALTELYNAGAAVDVMTVHQWLVDRKEAEAVGSPGILAELLTGFATHLNVGSYIRIVKDKSLLRRLQAACSAIVRAIQESPDAVSTVLDLAESEIFAVTNLEASKGLTTGAEELTHAIAMIEARGRRKGHLQGIQTGFHKLDEATAGWMPGDMIVLAARPGQGKTALALTFARHALDQRYDEASDSWKKPGHAVGIFSLEMTNPQLMLRLLASYASEGLQRIRQGDLDEFSMNKLRLVAGDMKEWPLYLDDSSFLSINQLRAKARRMKQKWGIELLIVDYLQLLRSESAQAKDNRQNEVAEISRGIKALAKELNIPIIILAQLNRRSEETKAEPALHNLRESGAIEQDADVVMLLHREEMSDDDSVQSKERFSQAHVLPYVLNIAKQRNGPTERVNILFHAPYTRFDDPIRHETRSVA